MEFIEWTHRGVRGLRLDLLDQPAYGGGRKGDRVSKVILEQGGSALSRRFLELHFADGDSATVFAGELEHLFAAYEIGQEALRVRVEGEDQGSQVRPPATKYRNHRWWCTGADQVEACPFCSEDTGGWRSSAQMHDMATACADEAENAAREYKLLLASASIDKAVRFEVAAALDAHPKHRGALFRNAIALATSAGYSGLARQLLKFGSKESSQAVRGELLQALGVEVLPRVRDPELRDRYLEARLMVYLSGGARSE